MPDFQVFLQNQLLRAPGILLGLTIHEYSHGLVALWRGDETANRAGRLSFNPLAHLDVFGTIMLCFTSFGWAKPVPIDYRNFQNPRRDTALVSLAGPLSNIIFAGILGIILQVLVLNSISVPESEYVFPILTIACQISLGLSFFNLLPIPPLDGSNILLSVLPRSKVHHFVNATRYVPMIFLILIAIEILTPIRALSLILNPLYVPYSSFWNFLIFGGRM